MQTTTTEQPNTMDEPGGPEAPMPARNRDANEKGGAGSTRKDKAAHGAPTDADFEPPVVPRESKGAPPKGAPPKGAPPKGAPPKGAQRN